MIESARLAGLWDAGATNCLGQIEPFVGYGLHADNPTQFLDRVRRLHQTRKLPSLHLALREQGRIVAVASFVGHQLLFHGDALAAYQVLGIRVCPEYSPDDSAAALLQEASRQMERDRVAFLWWSCDPTSRRLDFTKLGFVDHGEFVNIRIPRRWRSRIFPKHRNEVEMESVLETGVFQNNFELLHLHRNVWQDPIQAVEDHTNTCLWGAGTPDGGFRVGGINLNNPFFIDEIFRETFRSLQPRWIDLCLHRSSALTKLFRRPKRLKRRLYVKALAHAPLTPSQLHFSAGSWDNLFGPLT